MLLVIGFLHVASCSCSVACFMIMSLSVLSHNRNENYSYFFSNSLSPPFNVISLGGSQT